jgi:hypothetical protein
MLTCFSIFISLFLIILGLVAIAIGIRTYMHLCSARLATDGDIVSDHPTFILHGLSEGDLLYMPSRPFYTLASVTVVGLLPLAFGVLLFVRAVGLF